ncbi:MAG: hypothetical protein D6752_06345 [Candidatus Nitrosothermus koennekii]|nr:MAG: hypothetical protein D6752_06345 [Candidatus Nitrosothermus koennekii]
MVIKGGISMNNKSILIIALVIAVGIGAYASISINELNQFKKKSIGLENNEESLIVSSLIERTTLEQKVIDADAIIIGKVVEVGDVFKLADPSDDPDEDVIYWPFRDITISVERIIYGDELINKYEDNNYLKVRVLAEINSDKWFEVNERHLLFIGESDKDYIYGPNTLFITSNNFGIFLLKDGKAYNIQEGVMSQTELLTRISVALQGK